MDAKHNSFHTMTGSEHCRYTRRIIENIIKKIHNMKLIKSRHTD